MRKEIKRLTVCGLLIALSYVSLWFIRIPIIPSAPFLRLDIKDAFIAVMGMLFGPVYAVAGALCLALLQMFSVSEYGFIGLIMNALSSAAFTIPITVIYNKKKTQKQLIIGLVFGTISLTIAMLLWNYLITPFYMGVSREAVRDMLLPVFLPFNVIKGITNSILTFICIGIVERVVKSGSAE